jgi:hypothetical protein
VGGGEAGYIAPYLPDPDIVSRAITRATVDHVRQAHGPGESRSARPPELSDGKGAAAILEHRFQWTAPLLISPHDPNVALPRRRAALPHHRRRRSALGSHLGRPHAQRQEQAATLRRPHHHRRHGHGVLRHHLRRGRVAAREGPDLGGRRRWPRARHPRWRQELDGCHAQGDAGVEQDQPDRGFAATTPARPGSLWTGTPSDDLTAVHLRHHGLRQDLETVGARASPKARSCAPCAKIRSARPALRRNGNRRFCFLQRGRKLGIAATESADRRRCTTC